MCVLVYMIGIRVVFNVSFKYVEFFASVGHIP